MTLIFAISLVRSLRLTFEFVYITINASIHAERTNIITTARILLIETSTELAISDAVDAPVTISSLRKSDAKFLISCSSTYDFAVTIIYRHCGGVPKISS